MVKEIDEGLSSRAWPVTSLSLLSAPSSFHLPPSMTSPPPLLLSSVTLCWSLDIADLNRQEQKGVQNPAGGWHPSRNLVCMGSGRSQPLHIHMLSVLADPSARGSCRETERRCAASCINACRCASAETHSQALVSAKEKVTHKLAHVGISVSFKFYM